MRKATPLLSYVFEPISNSTPETAGSLTWSYSSESFLGSVTSISPFCSGGLTSSSRKSAPSSDVNKKQLTNALALFERCRIIQVMAIGK